MGQPSRLRCIKVEYRRDQSFFSAICRVSWRVDRTRGLYRSDVTGTPKCSWLGNVEYRLDSAQQVERSERNLTLNETLVTKARLPANSLSTGYPRNSTLRSRPRVNAGWIFSRGVALGYSRMTLWTIKAVTFHFILLCA